VVSEQMQVAHIGPEIARCDKCAGVIYDGDARSWQTIGDKTTHYCRYCCPKLRIDTSMTPTKQNLRDAADAWAVENKGEIADAVSVSVKPEPYGPRVVKGDATMTFGISVVRLKLQFSTSGWVLLRHEESSPAS